MCVEATESWEIAVALFVDFHVAAEFPQSPFDADETYDGLHAPVNTQGPQCFDPRLSFDIGSAVPHGAWAGCAETARVVRAVHSCVCDIGYGYNGCDDRSGGVRCGTHF